MYIEANNMLRVTVGNGKYTVVQNEQGSLSALRYGKEWRDCCGDNLILTLAQRIEELEDMVESLTESNESLLQDVYSLIEELE